jgi:hypothetical protein
MKAMKVLRQILFMFAIATAMSVAAAAQDKKPPPPKEKPPVVNPAPSKPPPEPKPKKPSEGLAFWKNDSIEAV